MRLLPGVAERVKTYVAASGGDSRPVLEPRLPVDLPRASADRVIVVDDASAQRLVARLASVSISAAAIHSVYSHSPQVLSRDGAEWTDVRSRRPVCFAIAAWATQPRAEFDSGVVLRAVLDVRTEAGRNA